MLALQVRSRGVAGCQRGPRTIQRRQQQVARTRRLQDRGRWLQDRVCSGAEVGSEERDHGIRQTAEGLNAYALTSACMQ